MPRANGTMPILTWPQYSITGRESGAMFMITTSNQTKITAAVLYFAFRRYGAEPHPERIHECGVKLNPSAPARARKNPTGGNSATERKWEIFDFVLDLKTAPIIRAHWYSIFVWFNRVIPALSLVSWSRSKFSMQFSNHSLRKQPALKSIWILFNIPKIDTQWMC